MTSSSGIQFQHAISPEKKYIVEAMSGGVLLLDYDQDGWLDIYFTNAPSVAMALRGEKAKSALYRNNHDGTFTDVTDKAGVGYPCWAMGGAVADYNNDGWPDMLITCAEGMVLYRNNGNGTFTEKGVLAGVAFSEDGVARAGMGVDAADYDRSGAPSILISNFSNQMLALYHNEGKGLFVDEAPRSEVGRASLLTLGFSCFFFDYDNDG